MPQNPDNITWEEEVVQRVRRGMMFLEEKYGPDWPDMFTEKDMETLDLKSGACCVLGTIHKRRASDLWCDNYPTECVSVGLEPGGTDVQKYGFLLSASESHDFSRWDTLTETWRRAIQTRKANR